MNIRIEGATVGIRSRRVAWQRHIRTVLETWTKIQRRLQVLVDDQPKCTTERACVGLLAAAAWCSKQIAIEEYSALRGGPWQGPGRVDLYLHLGRGSLS